MSIIFKSMISKIILQLSFLPQTLKLIWTANRTLSLFWAILLIFQGFVPVAVVYLTRILVDSLVAVVGTGASWENIKPVFLQASLMGGLLSLTHILQIAMTWVRTAQAEQTGDYISSLIHAKSVSFDLSFYEIPDCLDRLHQVSNDLKNRPLTLLENLGGLIQSGITVLSMGALLIPYGVWLPFVLIGSTLPAFYVLLRTNRRFHIWWKQSTTNRRWVDYYDSVLTEDVFAAELRLFEFGPYIQKAYHDLRSVLRKEKLDLIKKQGFSRLWASVFGLLISSGALAWMVWRAFQD